MNTRLPAIFVITTAALFAQVDTRVPGVSILISSDAKSGYRFVLRNDLASPVSYAGYDGENSTQPVYTLEVFQEGKWVDRSPGWCGLGMGACNLAGKSSTAFPLEDIYHAAKEGQKFRVSVRFIAAPKSAWTKPATAVRVVSNEAILALPKKG